MIEVTIHKANRTIVNMKEFMTAFHQVKDGKCVVTFKDVRKRSLPQNSYYWKVVVPAVRSGLYDAGYDEVRTNEDAHVVLKQIHLTRKMENKKNGDVIPIAGSSRKLSVPEFNIYIETICKWAAEYLGIVIPSPNQQLAEYEEWQESITEQSIV
jgi:hypothetical protein